MATPLRKGLAALDGLDLAALLFALVLAMALLSLSPFSPGGSHPIWAWAGVTPGSGTINRSATLLEIVKLLGLACAFIDWRHAWRAQGSSPGYRGGHHLGRRCVLGDLPDPVRRPSSGLDGARTD